MGFVWWTFDAIGELVDRIAEKIAKALHGKK
jgi:hypothetical protein